MVAVIAAIFAEVKMQLPPATKGGHGVQFDPTNSNRPHARGSDDALVAAKPCLLVDEAPESDDNNSPEEASFKTAAIQS
jgi:hypothetical protein